MDMAPDPDGYAIHYRFLETFDESFDYGTDPVPARAAGRSTASACPTRSCARCTATTPGGSSALGPS